jgi:DNA-binding NarL/FixJ family response regulator
MIVVDEHDVFRLGLKALVGGELRGELEIVAEARSARDSFPLVEREKPGLVTLDLVLPGMDGVTATRELIRRTPGLNVLVISADEAVDDVLTVLDAGARGYALKSDSSAEIATALRRTAQGKRYVTPALADVVGRHPSGGTPSLLRVLSERETEVFRLACEAMTNAEIARELCISKKTVETHLYRIHKKFGVRNASELIFFAAMNGLLRPVRIKPVTAWGPDDSELQPELAAALAEAPLGETRQ